MHTNSSNKTSIPTCLYFLRPYSDFHIEHNPVLLIND